MYLLRTSRESVVRFDIANITVTAKLINTNEVFNHTQERAGLGMIPKSTISLYCFRVPARHASDTYHEFSTTKVPPRFFSKVEIYS
jgi:hypothetical protein